MTTPVGKSVLIYGVAFAIAGATPFLLLPVLTRLLTPEQFGVVTAFLIRVAVLGNVAGMSAHGFVAVRYFKSPRRAFADIVGSSLAAIGVSHLAAALLVALAFPWLRHAVDLEFDLTLLAVGTALVLNLNLVFLAIFQSSGQPWLYLRARLVQGVIEFGACLALLTLLMPDVGSRVYTYALAIAASAALGYWHCRRHGLVSWRIDKTHLRSLASFGLPMLPHVVAGSAVVYIDRLVVSSVLGAQSLGIYMVSMQIGMVLVALIEPLNKALAPWLFGQLAKDDPTVRRRIVQRTYQLYGALASVGLALALVAHVFFDQLIGAGFRDARPLIPWMIGGYVLQGMYYSVVNYLFYAERTGRLSVVSGTTAVLGLGISYGLTSFWGLKGAGISFLTNNALLFGLVWWVAARSVPMPWSLRQT